MEVVIDRLEGLECRVTVTLPSNKAEKKTHEQLKDLATRIKLKGFRKKNIPFNEVVKRYGQSVFQEVAIEEMKSSLNEIILQEKLFPAAVPTINIETVKSGEPLTFIAEFEEYPTIQLIDFKQLQLERLNTIVNEEQINKVIERLQKQQANWIQVNRACKIGDKICVDFIGKINGATFPGSTATNMEIELGSGMMLQEFEKQLLGAEANQQLTVTLTFPANYYPHLLGKTAEFDVTVHRVLEAQLPKIDDKFVKNTGLGVCNEQTLREKIRENIEDQMKSLMQNRLKMQLVDLLTEKHTVILPKVMVAAEIKRLEHEQAHMHDHDHANCTHKHPSIEMSKEKLSKEAERHVKQALILRQIMQVYNIKADSKKVRQYILDNFKTPQNTDEETLAWFKKDQKYANVEALILEDQILAEVLEQVQITERKISYEDAIKLTQKKDIK